MCNGLIFNGKLSKVIQYLRTYIYLDTIMCLDDKQ